MNKVVLRELPGIADLEVKVATCETLMADELQDLRRQIDTVCLTLFGITPGEAATPPDNRYSWDEWQALFEFLDGDFEEQEEAFWEAFSIDTDGPDGFQLECVDFIGRPLVCALRQLHPAASLRFAPGLKSDDQLAAEAEAWGRWLVESRAKRSF